METPWTSQNFPDFSTLVSAIRERTPWVDQACADCVLARGAGDAPSPELHPRASDCAPDS